MAKVEELKIRPYARLLTMLGEQLIKNERIALIELVKNSYDADADWVKISFINFGENFEKNKNSKIVIEDDGDGMSVDIIKKHWANPATPEKYNRKRDNNSTKKGRIIQGEKGIGRFSIFKLGRDIKLVTRAENSDVEHIVKCDFSRYDDEFLSDEGHEKELYIDDLTITLETFNPSIIKAQKITLGSKQVDRKPQGTIIEISNLKGSWSDNKVRDVYNDLARLEPIFIEQLPEDEVTDINIRETDLDTEEIDIFHRAFEIYIYKDSTIRTYPEEYIEKLNNILDTTSVFAITGGKYDDKQKQFTFSINGSQQSLCLTDEPISGLTVFRNWLKKRQETPVSLNTECGPFSFGLYIFDFSNQAPPKYKLDKEQKSIIRSHRIYLYRDGIRVYPYGEPEDDWLKIDAYRGTISAGDFLSNDQVVGYVNISQKLNPNLRDKTNREGLIEEGNATDDFISLMQAFLAYIRQGPYSRYRIDIQRKSIQDNYRNNKVKEDFEKLRKLTAHDKTILKQVSETERAYEIERNFLVSRAETTEDLAGVGLSVETASHDIMAFMGKVLASIDNLIRDTLHKSTIDIKVLQDELNTLRGLLSFIDAQLRDIQLLFKSSKQKRRDIAVLDILTKIKRIYQGQLDDDGIALSIDVIGSPVIAKTTDAVLMQLFINLLDNSIYWFKYSSVSEKRILIHLNGNRNCMIFSDSGSGVNPDDVPYIFEPFYSGKGAEGRGLGLYIARQLLERHDYSIELSDLKSDKLLLGANFFINFVSEAD